MLRLQNIFLISFWVSTLISCATNSTKYPNSEAEIIKANHDIEFSDARMPAGETIANDVTAADRKISQSLDGIAFAAATLATLQGTWSSKCTRAYTKDAPAWFLETLKFDSGYYTKSVVKFADSACKKPLQQVINSKIKIEMTVSTPSGFRLTNNWDEAKQTLSSSSIPAKNCDQETVFPGCSESSFTSQRKAPWLIAALSGSDELLTDKHSPDFANCEKPQLADGEKWCLLLKKSSQ